MAGTRKVRYTQAYFNEPETEGAPASTVAK